MKHKILFCMFAFMAGTAVSYRLPSKDDGTRQVRRRDSFAGWNATVRAYDYKGFYMSATMGGQNLEMEVDLGSSATWAISPGLAPTQFEPDGYHWGTYDPTKSSPSASPLGTNSLTVYYGDSTQARGPMSPIAQATSENLFSPRSGILALDRGPNGISPDNQKTLVDVLLLTLPSSKISFALAPVGTDGYMVLGDIIVLDSDMIELDLYKPPQDGMLHWGTNNVDILIDDTKLGSVDSMIFDTGSTFIWLPDQIAQAYLEAAGADGGSNDGFPTVDCDHDTPNLNVQLGSRKAVISGQALRLKYEEKCEVLVRGQNTTTGTLGIPFFVEHLVTLDLYSQKVSYSV